MNRLWVRLSLATSGFILLFVALPLLALLLGFLFMGPHESYESGRGMMTTGEFQRAARAIPEVLLRVMFFIGLVGVGAGVLVSRGLSRPIAAMSRAAQEFGRGNLDRRVQVKGSKEITDLADAFNQMADDLQRAEQQRRSLMADVAHELRTPLTVLEGNLRAALDRVYELDEQNLANLVSQTRHLSRLVDELHELTLAEARHLPLDRLEINVAAIARETADVFAPLAEEKGVTLVVDLPESAPAFADPNRVRQVAHNLLANGLRHTPAGGTITVTTTTDDDATTLRVADSGEGILPEHLPHLFDRFYRTDASRARSTGGSGLGLAIVRALVEAQNGRVAVTSPGRDQGATFTVTLPRRAAD